jgi:hypothetical protein
MSTPEGQVLNAILDYLAARHVFAIRMNTGAMVSEYKGKKRFMRFGMPGMADILAFRNHPRRYDADFDGEVDDITPLWIEVKAPKGKQSELQSSFQERVEAEGHSYVLARCIEDVERFL